MTDDGLLHRISSGIAEANAGQVPYKWAESLTGDLLRVWNPEDRSLHEEVRYSALPFEKPRESAFDKQAPRPIVKPAPPPQRPPPWYIGMSSTFSKDIHKIDRKLQGRILEAIAEITQQPMVLRGDTVKPLVGEFQGCWRYRLGDFRLIYSPNKSTGNITLLAFAPRGSAYVD